MDHYYELITALATVSLTKHFQWNQYIFALIFNALPRVTIKLKMYIDIFFKKTDSNAFKNWQLCTYFT